MMSETSLVVLATGGTGGHVFPAEALAEELQARGRRLALITDRRGGAFGGRLGSLDTHRIRASGLAGKGLSGKIRGGFDLAFGTLQARRLLGRLDPAVVVGFGGYASVPTMLAATMAGTRTLLHEQNAVLGRANRLLCGRVDTLATSFARQEGLPDTVGTELVHTGLPVRPGILAARETGYDPPRADGPLRLLVLGGSQGARVFSTVIPAMALLLPEPLKPRLEIVQQCRPEDVQTTTAAFAEAGVQAEIAPFFDDVPRRLARCHLLIARAGASTIAEMTCVGRPALLVPYPHAIDDHQTRNAHALDEAGGGWLTPEAHFTPEALADRLIDLATMPETLRQAARCAGAVGRPDAARRLADLVEKLLKSNGAPKPDGRLAA